MCNLQMKILNLEGGEHSTKDYVAEADQPWDDLALSEPEWVDAKDLSLREKQIQ